jgi:FkbM family methyltransferase
LTKEGRRLRSFARVAPDQVAQIYVREVFGFETDDPAPRLIDGGANLGLVTRYWKQRYPAANVTAIEADPALCKRIRQNVPADVEIVQAALWTEIGEMHFQADGTDAGRLTSNGAHGVITVPTVPLAQFLEEPVALLKLDIEGAEVEVLRAAEPSLGNVERLALEFHSFEAEPQHLHEMLALLERSGFRYFVQHEMPVRRPFVDSWSWGPFDNQLLIFGVRPPADHLRRG